MFDRSACVRMRVAANAHIDLSALTTLAALVRDALNDPFCIIEYPSDVDR
jgi:hypothetical protein